MRSLGFLALIVIVMSSTIANASNPSNASSDASPASTAVPTQTAAPAQAMSTNAPDLAQLQQMTARFAPTELNVDISGLSVGDRRALVKLIEAARLIDDIFLTQYWSGNHALYASLQKDHTPLGKARLHYFWLNKGPWSSLDGDQAFLPDVPAHKLPGANFYPESMTKEQFESWVAKLPEEQQRQAKGFFTVIADDGKGGLQYSSL